MNNEVYPSKYIQSKKVIFLIRHENDLDFMLPIMLYACNPIVFLWGNIPAADFRLVMLRDKGINPVRLDGLSKSIAERVILKILRTFRLPFLAWYSARINDKSQEKTVLSLTDNLKKMKPGDVNLIVFDHTVNNTVCVIIDAIRKWQSNHLSIISLPHGHGTVANSMTKYAKIKPDNNVDWSIFDKLICFNKHQATLYETIDRSRISVIHSLRDTTEWVDLLGRKIPAITQKPTRDRLESQKSEKIKILFIHTRLPSNINSEEMIRSIKVLDQFKCFDIRIKPHPRRISNALELLKMSDQISLMQEHITECVRWADCVLFFQSSAIFDAFILNKPVLYQNYVSSNIVFDEILKHCNVLNTPDDFYHIVQRLANRDKIKTPNYTPPKWRDLVDEWALLLN